MHLVEVVNKKLLKEFIYLPEKLYCNYPNYVPPLFADEEAFHDLNKNIAHRSSDTIRFIAVEQGQPVGRIMGIVHHAYNTQHNEKTVRFYQLDCIDNLLVTKILLTGIESWAKDMGMEKIIGPYGFSDKDPQGYQIEGFEYLPVISAPNNPPYLPGHLETLGFLKEFDCVSYRITINEKLPEAYQAVYQRVSLNKSIRLLEFKTKNQLKPYIVPVFRLVNEAYAHLFGFTPMTEAEMKKFAAQYLPVLDPEFVKVVVDMSGEVVAFVVAVPDMSKGIQKARGRLFPFGFIHILSSRKKSTQLDLLLGALKPGYRKRGITVLLAQAMMQSAIKRKIHTMDSHLVLESNAAMRAEYENLGAEIYKRYRIFGKALIK
jgi:GNAT superfamily N-acetyltransferase